MCTFYRWTGRQKKETKRNQRKLIATLLWKKKVHTLHITLDFSFVNKCSESVQAVFGLNFGGSIYKYKCQFLSLVFFISPCRVYRLYIYIYIYKYITKCKGHKIAIVIINTTSSIITIIIEVTHCTISVQTAFVNIVQFYTFWESITHLLLNPTDRERESWDRLVLPYC